MISTLLALLLALLVSSAALATETTQTVFWEALKAKVEKVTPRKKTSTTTAVGGVRSAKQQETELYWKGKEQPLEANEEELDIFKQALMKGAGGQRQESIKLFEAFLGRYPQSQLKSDCLKALDQLKQEK